MNIIKKISVSIITFSLLVTGLFAEEDINKNLESIPEGYQEYSLTFSNSKIDLSKEQLLPTTELIGHSYKLKDDENKVKIIFNFKKDYTYSFKTKALMFTVIMNGKYEIDGNKLILHPEKPEGRFLGIKIENMNVEDSAYNDECFECFVYKKGILLDDEFYSRI